MTTDCRVRKCKNNINGKCDLGIRNRKRCNVFLYYCDPAHVYVMSISEAAYCRKMLGKLKPETNTIKGDAVNV